MNAPADLRSENPVRATINLSVDGPFTKAGYLPPDRFELYIDPGVRVTARRACTILVEDAAKHCRSFGIWHGKLPLATPGNHNRGRLPALLSMLIPAARIRGRGLPFRNVRRQPRNLPYHAHLSGNACMEEETMDGLIYLVGLIVIIMFILSLFGLR